MIEPLPITMRAPRTPSITIVNLDAILWHSLVEDLPRWADDAPELYELANDIAARGLDYPLIVTETDQGKAAEGYWRLIDGRHRFMAAGLAGLAEVPVEVVPEEAAAGIVLNSLFQRRHYTKSAQALLLYEMFPSLQARAGKRGNATGNNQHGSGNVTTVTFPPDTFTAEDFAAKRGIPRQYFSCINTVRNATRTPDEWQMVRRWVLEEEKSWSKMLPALEGWQATHDPHEAGEDAAPPKKAPVDVFGGFVKSFTFISRQAAAWNTLADEERQRLRAMWHDIRKVLPKELL